MGSYRFVCFIVITNGNIDVTNVQLIGMSIGKNKPGFFIVPKHKQLALHVPPTTNNFRIFCEAASACTR